MRAILSLLLTVSTLAAKPAKKGDPMAPETWATSPTLFEGKSVRTSVLRMADPGLVAGDAPAAIVEILGGNERGEAGGLLCVVVPLDQFQSFTTHYSQMEAGKGRTGFGVVAKPRVLQGTFVRIQGEPALLVDLPSTLARTLPKPSELLQAQRQRSREQALQPVREGWSRRPFLTSRLDQRQQPETTRELQRLADLANAAKAKSDPRTSTRDLVQRTKAGESVVIEDPKAKTEWLLTWD